MWWSLPALPTAASATTTMSEWLSSLPSTPEELKEACSLPQGLLSDTPDGTEGGGGGHHYYYKLIIVFILIIILSPLLLNMSAWILWILISIIVGTSRTIYSIFVVSHVLVDVWALSTMKTGYTIYRFLRIHLFSKKSTSSTRQQLMASSSFARYEELAKKVDEEDGAAAWREDESDLPQADVLKMTIAKLDESLNARDVQKLQFTLLNGLLKRNHLGIDERALHLRALSGTKHLVEAYDQKVVECINFICDCDELSREEKTSFFKKARRALGQTALLLSGGGSIAMYHAGTVRALINAGLYRYIRVISGTSGGSIIAGMLAISTEKELMSNVLVKTVSTDFKKDGEMKRRKIVWFPPLLEQAKHFLKEGVLIKNEDFKKTCEFYYADITFEEAFQRTRKHVCISVASSTLGAKNRGNPRLLLNHISTPNVLIRSAVAASCSLPGIMRPNSLLCKSETGEVVPFEMDGVQYVDGSLQADLPFRRISTLFAVSHFIVSQVNFHVVPFLHKPHSPAENSLYWSLFRFFDMDIRHRVTTLADLGLLPRVFGQDVSGIFKQRYYGNVTITPTFRWSEMIGLKAFMHPTESEMAHYILGGQRSTWMMLNHIKHNTLVERSLADCMAKLRRQAFVASMGGGNGSTSSQQLAGQAMSNSNGTGSGNSTPRALPPLVPTSSASNSRSNTPLRRHHDETIFPPPSIMSTSTLAPPLPRSDSMRFYDDDGDMLQNGGGNTPSSASSPRRPADGGGAGSVGGAPAFVNPAEDRANNQLQRLGVVAAANGHGNGGSNGSSSNNIANLINGSKVLKELEAENKELKERVARLEANLQEILGRTERGIYHHNVSMAPSDMSDVPSVSRDSSSTSFMTRDSSLHSTISPTSGGQ